MLEEQQELGNSRVSRQKGDLKAELEMLAQKKEIEAARAEIEADEQDQEKVDIRDFDIDQEVKAAEQTAKYV